MTATAIAAASSKYTPSSDLLSSPNLVGGMWNNMRDRLTLYAEIEQRKNEHNNKMRTKAMRQMKKQANKARQKLAKLLTELNHAILFDIIRIDVDQQANTGDSSRFAHIELKNLQDVPGEPEEVSPPSAMLSDYINQPPRVARNQNSRRWNVAYDVGVTSIISNQYQPVIQYTAYEMNGGSRLRQIHDDDPNVVLDQLLRWIATQSLLAKARWGQPASTPSPTPVAVPTAPAVTFAAAQESSAFLSSTPYEEDYDYGSSPLSAAWGISSNESSGNVDPTPARTASTTATASGTYGSYGRGAFRRVATAVSSAPSPLYANIEGSSADGSV